MSDGGYEDRLARLMSAMHDHEVDVVLLSVGSDLPYVTGYRAMPLERVTMLVVRESGATLVVPELEAPRVEPVGDAFDIRPWSETEDPLDIIAHLAATPGTVAISDETWSRFVLGLQARMPLVAWVNAGDLTQPLRMRKTPDEIAALRAAAVAADRVAGRLPAESWTGRSEHDLASRIADLLVSEGHGTVDFTIVASGPNGASPHHEPGKRIMGPGDVVVCDFGGHLDGYCSDTTRTFSIGPPDGEVAEAHAVLLDAQQAAVAAVEPGVTAESIDAVARAMLDDAGYGDYFIHRTGHGIGLDVHEHPYIVDGNDTVLEAGMAFSIEPGIYVPGRWGMRIEDIVVVTDDGVESLNRSDRRLIVVD